MIHMKKYEDYKKIEDIPWTKYVIIVPTEEDKKELEEAFEHIHYSDIDTDNIAVNQLAHEYLTPEITGDERSINNIVVDPVSYEKLKIKR
jgi:hypothetical protein